MSKPVTTLFAQEQLLEFAAASPPPAGVIDTFAGAADSLLADHLADTGQAWSVPTSPSSAVLDGSGAVLTAGRGSPWTAVIDAAIADATYSVTFHCAAADFSTNPGFIFRWVDGSNYWWVGWNGFSLALTLFKVVAGTPTTVAIDTVDMTTPGDYTISVVLAGSSITVKVNGTTVQTATDAQFQTATLYGFNTDMPATNGWYKNLTISP